MIISSLQNPKVKQLVALRKSRDRKDAGVVIIEGYEELALAVASGMTVKEVYYCPELMPDNGTLGLLERLGGAQSFELSRAVFEKAAYREGPDGWLAVADMPRRSLSDVRLPERPLILVMEGIEKPGNIGAMLRSADAAGVDLVLSVDAVTDLANPNVVRSSKGTVFSVPVVACLRAEALAWLKQQGVKVLAATPAAEQRYSDADLRGGVAIAVGAEKPGLTEAFLNAADLKVRIPMAGKIDSLNVAASAAIMLFEAVRQRG